MLKNLLYNPEGNMDTGGGAGLQAPPAPQITTVTPPVEVKAGETIDLGGFEDAVEGAEISTPTEPELSVKPPADKPDVEPLDVNEPVIVNEPTATKTSTAPAPAPATGRDYSVFAEEDREMLKKMPNIAYDYLKQRLPKLYAEANKAKELETKLASSTNGELPPAWYEHPQAFVLSPKFQETQKSLTRIEFEQNHYREQAALVEGGADKYTVISKYDAKTGQPILEEVPVSPDMQIKAKNDLLSIVFSAESLKQQRSGELNNLVNGFRNQYTQIANTLKAKEREYFPFLEETPDKPLDPAIKKLLTDTEQLVPAQFRNHPLAPYTIKSGATIQLLLAQKKQLEAEIATLKGIKRDAQLAGPSGSEISGAPSSGGKSTVVDVSKMFGDDEE